MIKAALCALVSFVSPCAVLGVHTNGVFAIVLERERSEVRLVEDIIVDNHADYIEVFRAAQDRAPVGFRKFRNAFIVAGPANKFFHGVDAVLCHRGSRMKESSPRMLTAHDHFIAPTIGVDHRWRQDAEPNELLHFMNGRLSHVLKRYFDFGFRSYDKILNVTGLNNHVGAQLSSVRFVGVSDGAPSGNCETHRCEDQRQRGSGNPEIPLLVKWLIGVCVGAAIFVRGLWGLSGRRDQRAWLTVSVIGFVVLAAAWLSPWGI